MFALAYVLFIGIIFIIGSNPIFYVIDTVLFIELGCEFEGLALVRGELIAELAAPHLCSVFIINFAFTVRNNLSVGFVRTGNIQFKLIVH